MVARTRGQAKVKIFIDNLFEDFISLAGDRYYVKINQLLLALQNLIENQY